MMTTLNSILSNALFSTIVTFYTIILIYFPSPLFLYLVSSPILFSTIVLLLILLRLGATQNYVTTKNESIHQNKGLINHDPILKHEIRREPSPDHNPTKIYVKPFIEWDVRAPLEVIYEEHEGEEAEENDKITHTNIIEKYASLSSYYPDTDTDDSSEGDLPTWDSPENMFFQWEDGLIEITLDDQKKCSDVEEDNMIEIELFPAR